MSASAHHGLPGGTPAGKYGETTNLDRISAHAVDEFDLAAHLEATGFGTPAAQASGSTDIFEFASAVPLGISSAQQSVHERVISVGVFRAMLLIGGSVAVATILPQQSDFFTVTMVAGISGWILSQIVGAVIWKRYGAGDPSMAIRAGIKTAAITVFFIIFPASAAAWFFLLRDMVHIGIALAVIAVWCLYALAITLVSIFGSIRFLGTVAAICGTLCLLASIADHRIVAQSAAALLISTAVIQAGLLLRRRLTKGSWALNRFDSLSAIWGGFHAALLATSLLWALNEVQPSLRTALIIGAVIAAALCEPAVEIVGHRLASLSRIGTRWKNVQRQAAVVVLVITLIVAAVSCAVTVGVAGLTTAPTLNEKLEAAELVLVFAFVIMSTAVVLRVGRASGAIHIALSLWIFFALTYFVAAGALVILSGFFCLAISASHMVSAAIHPSSW